MHPNAQVVMRGFQAFAEGDMSTMRALFSDDATWHSGGRNKWSGDRTGTDAIMGLMAGVSEEATITNEPHAILADDDHVVVLVTGTSTRGSKTFSGDTVFVFHVDGDKVTEAWSVPSDPYGLDEFWAD